MSAVNDVPSEFQPSYRVGQDQVLAPKMLALRTLRNLRKSFNWAWLDTVCQYRRSKIGPLWETINVSVMVFGITVVSSAVIGGSMTSLAAYIGLGIIIWSALSAVITEGTTTFIRNANNITTTNFSIDLYLGRTLFKAMINLCHHAVLYVVGILVLPMYFGWISLLALVGLFLFFLNAYWVIVFFAFVAARFRDVEMIVRNLLQLAFFVTPVFWDYRNIRSDRQFIIDYNVLYYFIEIIRAPLLGEIPPLSTYLTVLGVTVVGYSLAYFIYRRMRRQLAFFV